MKKIIISIIALGVLALGAYAKTAAELTAELDALKTQGAQGTEYIAWCETNSADISAALAAVKDNPTWTFEVYEGNPAPTSAQKQAAEAVRTLASRAAWSKPSLMSAWDTGAVYSLSWERYWTTTEDGAYTSFKTGGWKFGNKTVRPKWRLLSAISNDDFAAVWNMDIDATVQNGGIHSLFKCTDYLAKNVGRKTALEMYNKALSLEDVFDKNFANSSDTNAAKTLKKIQDLQDKMFLRVSRDKKLN